MFDFKNSPNEIPNFFYKWPILAVIKDLLNAAMLYLELSDEENLSSPSSDVPRPLKQRSNGKKLTMKSFSKYTNLIFNTAPKLLKKMKGYVNFSFTMVYQTER